MELTYKSLMAKMKNEIGDIFTVKTAKGVGFLQLVKPVLHQNDIELIKVFYDFYPKIPQDLNEVTKGDFYFLKFPINIAHKQKLVEKIGKVSLPNKFQLPTHFRDENPFGEGWHIINAKNWKRQTVLELTDDQRQLSPWSIISYPDLVERLENNWRLEDWI